MVTGGCQCGAVRYAISKALPPKVYVCHCRECQKQSASAFGVSVPVPRADFALTQGDVKTWSRSADSGATVDCAFCETCGTRLWHHSSAAPEVLRVRGGSFDQPLDLTHAWHIWTKRKLAGVEVPAGATSFPGQPE